MMELKKSDLTKFAKELAVAHKALFDAMCMSEEIVKSAIGRELKNSNKELLLELAKRFAKYAKSDAAIDIDNGDVQAAQDLINEIIYCCEDNDWFV